MVRRFRSLLLILLLLIPGQARAAQKEGRITAKAWALVEATSGRLLLGDNERDRRPMASTTKIMTALLVLEAGEDLDTLIVVPRRRRAPRALPCTLMRGRSSACGTFSTG